MLDQRLVRENPELIATQLGRRGLDVDLSSLQQIAQHQRDLEQERSTLQAEGNRIGKDVGQKIKAGADPKGAEVADLRQQGNTIKQKTAYEISLRLVGSEMCIRDRPRRPLSAHCLLSENLAYHHSRHG